MMHAQSGRRKVQKLRMRLLLVEDEMEMARALRAALVRHDCIVDHVATLAEAEEAVQSACHDAILLDWQLPDGEGVSLIPLAREVGQDVPIIMLTARGELSDRIAGLDAGADDYLPKPFATEELLARLRAVRRRSGSPIIETARLGRLTFDLAAGHAEVDDDPIRLARRELLVLEALMRRAGRVVLRATLEDAVYGYDDEIASNTLDAHISRLRRKLEAAGAGVEIHAIRGVGYLLKEMPR